MLRKPANIIRYNILSYLSKLTVAIRQTVRPTVNTVFMDRHCCSSVLMLRPTVWNSLPSFVRTADSFTIVLGLSSRLSMIASHLYSRSAVRASDTLTRSFARYKFVTYLLNLSAAFVFPVYFYQDEESSETGPNMILTSSTRERPASLHATVSRCRKRRSGV